MYVQISGYKDDFKNGDAYISSLNKASSSLRKNCLKNYLELASY